VSFLSKCYNHDAIALKLTNSDVFSCNLLQNF